MLSFSLDGEPLNVDEFDYEMTAATDSNLTVSSIPGPGRTVGHVLQKAGRGLENLVSRYVNRNASPPLDNAAMDYPTMVTEGGRPYPQTMDAPSLEGTNVGHGAEAYVAGVELHKGENEHLDTDRYHLDSSSHHSSDLATNSVLPLSPGKAENTLGVASVDATAPSSFLGEPHPGGTSSMNISSTSTPSPAVSSPHPPARFTLQKVDTESPPVDEHLGYTTIVPSSTVARQSNASERYGTSTALPSFEAAQYDIVLRRQRQRLPQGGGTKLPDIPSRFLNLSGDFEFSGWGTVSHLILSADQIRNAQEVIRRKRVERIYGHFVASAFPGNDILGGIYYTIPAILAVSGVLSPIAFFVATLVLFLWRPVMEELQSGLPTSGAPYTYLLQVTSKTFALVGAATLLLGFASKALVSSATVARYVIHELPFHSPEWACGASILGVSSVVAMINVKESAHVVLGMLTFHISTLVMLIVAGGVHWASIGNVNLIANWRMVNDASLWDVGRQMFHGVCIGMLGLTGFECTPSYVSKIKPGRFPSVLRNLHYSAMFFNTTCLLLVVAIIPLATNANDANALADIAQRSAGRWLRIVVVVDATLVLCGGVLSGILASSELLQCLAQDRILPTIFTRNLRTGAFHFCIIFFGVFCAILYSAFRSRLDMMSKMFSIVWLLVMALFPIAALLLKFNRGRIQRSRRTPLPIVFLALGLVPVILVGNILIDPTTIGYVATCVTVLVTLFSANQKKSTILHGIYWMYDQNPRLHRLHLMEQWENTLVGIMQSLQRNPVCVLIRTDDLNTMVQMTQYVSRYEETSCLKLVHFCGEDTDWIPSEMEANWKILDEAYSSMTIDLVLVHESFRPATVAALADFFNIPTSLMFMSCPGPEFLHSFTDFGTRIITL